MPCNTYQERKCCTFENEQLKVPFIKINRSDELESAAEDAQKAMASLAKSGIHFPLVAKPDRGDNGHGVRILFGQDDLMSI